MGNFEVVPSLPKPSVGMPGHSGKRTQVTKISLVPSFQGMGKAFGSFEEIPALPENFGRDAGASREEKPSHESFFGSFLFKERNTLRSVFWGKCIALQKRQDISAGGYGRETEKFERPGQRRHAVMEKICPLEMTFPAFFSKRFRFFPELCFVSIHHLHEAGHHGGVHAAAAGA